MTAQELLDALNQTQLENNLDQVAVRALSEYLQGIWKDSPGRSLRPFDLGHALSDFFVDLTLHRLPEKITYQTPQTEAELMDFFGAAGGGLSQFWTRCLEIWGVSLESKPAYAREVKIYFDLLLQSSLRGKRSDSTPVSVKSFVGPLEKNPQAAGSVPTSNGIKPKPPVSPVLVAAERPLEPSASIVAELFDKPEQADGPFPAAEEVVTATPALPPVPQNEPEPPALPRNGYLILQGTRVIPLNRPLIKIGRQLDNHIILEDPRVSRSHAQIKLIDDHFVIFDMGSTGGTFVNGQPTRQSVLYPGDVISLAGVIFLFSQELPARPGDLKIVKLGSPYAVDRPTAIVHRDEIKPANGIESKAPRDLPKTAPLK